MGQAAKDVMKLGMNITVQEQHNKIGEKNILKRLKNKLFHNYLLDDITSFPLRYSGSLLFIKWCDIAETTISSM